MSRRIAPTERGLRLLLGFGVSGLLALLFSDLFLVALAFMLGLLLLLDFLDARRWRLERVARFEPARFEARLLRGDEATFHTQVEALRDLEVMPAGLKGLTVTPPKLAKGRSELLVTFHANLVGRHAMSVLHVKAWTKRRLFAVHGAVSFAIEVKVYPRFLAAVAEALELLLRRGKGGEGEEPTSLKGPGLEYASTREHAPGDSLHHIDWKGTARRGALMVKEFYREGGAVLQVIYDVQAPGPITHDELATGFLNLLLGAAKRGTRCGITVHDAGRCMVHVPPGDPRLVLAAALQHVLEYNHVGTEDLYALLDLVPRRRLREAILRLENSVWRELFARGLPAAQVEHHDLRSLLRSSSCAGAFTEFVFVSGLTANPALLLELVDEIARQASVQIAYPGRPWLDVVSLEEAYRMKVQVEKALQALAKHGGRPLYLPRPRAVGPALVTTLAAPHLRQRTARVPALSR